MTRQYPYRISLYLYSGRIEHHYVHASNRPEATHKAQRFAVPIAVSGKDGVQFINATRLTKQECADRRISFED